MKEELENIEDFERYFEGAMSDDERTSFEQQMVFSTALKSEYELYLKVREALHAEGIRNKMAEIDKELDNQSVPTKAVPIKNSKGNFKNWFSVAAILVVIFASYFLLREKANVSEKYFIKDPGLPVLMSESSEDNLDKAMNAYKTGQYNEAIQILNSRALKYPSDTLDYYSGIVHFMKGDNEEATVEFEKITGSSSYFIKSRYYLALIAWQSSDFQKAKTLFQIVAANGAGQYAEKASSALKEIEK